jgi:hypothetical protein
MLCLFFEKKNKKNRKTIKFENKRTCQKNAKRRNILRLKRNNLQIPQLLSNFPRFLGFWEFLNHKFLFPICYRISLDLGNFPRSGTTENFVLNFELDLRRESFVSPFLFAISCLIASRRVVFAYLIFKQDEKSVLFCRRVI